MRKSMVFEGVAVTLLILLAFLMLAMILGGKDSNTSAVGDISYTYAGSDNMLYVFTADNEMLTADHIQAIDASGRQAWNFSIPHGWEVSKNCMPLYFYSDGSTYFSYINPSVASDNGILYVCLKPAHASISDHAMNVTLMAISSEGRTLWTLPIDSCAIPNPHTPDNSSDWVYGDVAIKALGNIVYVFHDFNETVLDSNGTVLWNVANVADVAAIDENGYIYLVKSRPATQNYTLYNTPASWLPQLSSTIDAYYPNGTLYWENYTSDRIQNQPLYNYEYYQSLKMYNMPIYHDGLLYAPTVSGIDVFYPNGTAKWKKTFSKDELKLDFPADLYQRPGWYIDQETAGVLSLYFVMPFDSRGNIYMEYQSTSNVLEYHKVLLLKLDSNGDLVSRQDISNNTIQYISNNSIYYQYINDGIGYGFSGQGTGNITNLTDLQGGAVGAYNIMSGKELWSYNISITGMNVATLDQANIRAILDSNAADEAINDYHNNVSYAGVRPAIYSGGSSDIKYGNGIVYVNFQSYNYEYPVVFGKSNAAYAGGIYALTDNGSLLWYKPVRARDFMQVTQNGTVFYRTPDGKIGVTSSGIAAGFTLTAILYLFLRFICVGAVARARARLDKNNNRNRVLDFVINSPGSTLYEVSRGTGVNLGTVRYHLFILGMNRKIVASSIDGKYIRYFTNSNSYSREQQLVISLFRRDTVGKILGLLARNPGMSNVEIAGEAGIPESITSRYLKELSEKGIVRNSSSGRARAYSIDEAYAGHVADAVRRIDGQ